MQLNFYNTLLVFLVILILLSGCVITFARKSVYAIFALMFSYICVAILINIVFDLEFISLLYVLIYIGAVAILFLFIVMMIPVEDKVKNSFIEH